MPDAGAERLARDQVAEAAGLVASAMHDDPAYRLIFPDESMRRSGLPDFFTRHLGAHLPHGCSFVARGDDGAVRATVTLRPPGGVPVPRAVFARVLLSFAFAHGPGALRRVLRVKQLYEALERHASEGRPYWHVHMMAVRPDLQGKGIGSVLLDETLRTARGGDPIVLTTHSEPNVRFYERAGFRVAHHEVARPPGIAPYPVWCMRREAIR